MKDKIKDIVSALGFIAVILFIIYGCDNKKDDESPILIVCDNEIYISDFYDNGIDYKSLEKEIDEACREYYYENPKEICNDYISNNKEELKADVCEE